MDVYPDFKELFALFNARKVDCGDEWALGMAEMLRIIFDMCCGVNYHGGNKLG